MDNVYLIWQEEHDSYALEMKCLDCGSYDTRKQVIRILGSKQEADEFLDYVNKNHAYDEYDDGRDCQYSYWITEHKFG